jgi:predicted transcriptional regulator
MAGKKQLAITERQFAVLELLWEHGPLTVRDVLARLPGGEDVPYTTALGLLQGMERAGLVAHGDEQPAHRYRPTLTRDQATGTLLGDFLRRFFRGSAERLVLGLVDARHLSADDLRAIEEKLQHPPPQTPDVPPSRRKKR